MNAARPDPDDTELRRPPPPPPPSTGDDPAYQQPYGYPPADAYPPGDAYPPPYGYPPGYSPMYPPQRRTSGLAIASLVLGILWLFWIGSLLALILGYMAKGEIDRSNGWVEGNGIAIAGIVLGWIGVGFFVLFVLLPIVLVAAVGV